MSATTAYCVAQNIRYGDFSMHFKPGRQDLMWYEPTSVVWNSPGCTDGEDVARKWAGDWPGSTIFIVENFTGHDISFLSNFPDEHEAMSRALTPFEVVHAQIGDPSSDDVLVQCDRVWLRQKPLRRRESIPCRELNIQDVKKYASYVRDMNLVTLFKYHFDIEEWDEESGVSKENMCHAWQHDEKLQGFSLAGSKGMKVKTEHSNSGDSINIAQTLVVYSQGVAQRYDFLCCRAVQSANFDEKAFVEAIQDRALKCRDDVRERLTNDHWFAYWFLSKRMFDRVFDLDGESAAEAQRGVSRLKSAEKETAFTDVLCGFMLATALEEKRLICQEGSSCEFRLSGKPFANCWA
jgi:hypothetical protein